MLASYHLDLSVQYVHKVDYMYKRARALCTLCKHVCANGVGTSPTKSGYRYVIGRGLTTQFHSRAEHATEKQRGHNLSAVYLHCTGTVAKAG